VTEFRGVIAILLLLTAVTPAPGDAPRESKLLRTLSGRNETIRMRAIVSIGVDGASQKEALDDLVAAVKRHAEETGDDELARPSTVRLIYLIGGIDDPRAESLLIEMLDAKHLGIAMVSADVLGKNKFYGAIEHLKKQIDRPDYSALYGFRFNLVRALAQMEHPDAVEFLSELRKTLDGQLAHQIDKLLADVTVNHFQGDEERYEKWKGPGKRERIFRPAAFEPESLNRINLGRANQYYGIDMHAKRMMFIIDNSGSMKKYWGGATRLEKAKNELIHAIEDLPHDSKFSIVFFHTTVNEWRSELLEATDENKLEAIQFVRRLGYGVKTNTYGALRRSLVFDDELESVFLLTDGKPTAGHIVSTGGIVADILRRNRFRHLNFNTIGIGVQGPTESFLRTLAEQSGGEFREAQ
jgi:hypothetical protein